MVSRTKLILSLVALAFVAPTTTFAATTSSTPTCVEKQCTFTVDVPDLQKSTGKVFDAVVKEANKVGNKACTVTGKKLKWHTELETLSIGYVTVGTKVGFKGNGNLTIKCDN